MKKRRIILAISFILWIFIIVGCNLFSIKKEKEIDLLIEIDSYSNNTIITFDSNNIIWSNALYYEENCSYSVNANTITLTQDISETTLNKNKKLLLFLKIKEPLNGYLNFRVTRDYEGEINLKFYPIEERQENEFLTNSIDFCWDVVSHSKELTSKAFTIATNSLYDEVDFNQNDYNLISEIDNVFNDYLDIIWDENIEITVYWDDAIRYNLKATDDIQSFNAITKLQQDRIDFYDDFDSSQWTYETPIKFHKSNETKNQVLYYYPAQYKDLKFAECIVFENRLDEWKISEHWLIYYRDYENETD